MFIFSRELEKLSIADRIVKQTLPDVNINFETWLTWPVREIKIYSSLRKLKKFLKSVSFPPSFD